MWVAASFGFLMPAIRPPKTVAVGDDRTMQIRARRARDLDILRAEYMKGKLGPTIHTPAFDYEYRAYCTPESFALAMARMVTEIDYLKFKPTTDRYEDDELHTCYNAIWSTVMSKLSTKGHQWDYWHKFPPVKTATSGTGYPKAVGGAKAVVDAELDTATFLDSEQQRLDDWLGSRNTAADRDEYVPDVASWNSDDTATMADISEIDALYAEIDAILDAQKEAGPIDHSQCSHADSDSARSRCRAKYRRQQENRIAEIHNLIEESRTDFEADRAADEAAADREWKGYPWESGKRQRA